MKTTEKTLKELYKIGNKETKDKLESEFPTIFKVKSLLETSIEYLTEQDCEVIKLRQLEKVLNENDNLLAEQKLIVIFKALNEKWIPNWNDSNEKKYYIWWDMNNFSYRGWYYDYSCSTVPARLCLKSGELVGKIKNNTEIVQLFKLYMLQ